MKFIKKSGINLIKEFNSENRNEILNRQNEFTISYEIELEAQSHFTDLSDMLDNFNYLFKSLIDKWDLDVSYDTSLIDRQDDVEFQVGNIYSFDDYNPDLIEEPTYEFYDQGDKGKYFIGIEIAPFTYVDGIDKAFQFLDEFYSLYNSQKSFLFSNKTGLHTNIGYKDKTNWNLLKGYLLFNEDYAYTGFTHRKENEFSASYKNEFREIVNIYTQQYEDLDSHTIRDNFYKIEKDLNRLLIKTTKNVGEKHAAFNILKVKDNNYIEFRHPGGKVKKDDLKRQTLYYSNIVLACVDPEYRKRDYQTKIFSYLKKIQ